MYKIFPGTETAGYILSLETSFQSACPNRLTLPKFFSWIHRIITVKTGGREPVHGISSRELWCTGIHEPGNAVLFQRPRYDHEQSVHCSVRYFKRKTYPGVPISWHTFGNSGVAQNGDIFSAWNYGRLARLRPVTGISWIIWLDHRRKTPSDDGHIQSGYWKILLGRARSACIVCFT